MDQRRVKNTIAIALLWPALLLGRGYGQQDSFAKNFQLFREIAPGIDFFAANRAAVAPFEKAILEARQKLATFLGNDLARGAIVVCTSLEQKDSVNEARVLKLGYRWVLIQLTPEAINQQMLAQIKSQMGGQVPPGLLEKLEKQPPEMKSASEARAVSGAMQQAAYAMISTTLAPDKVFRSSRLDDMGRSPLSDWLDIGLASYTAGTATANLRFLQDRMDEAFPVEDVLEMARPFVAPSSGNAGGPAGGGIMIRMAGPPPPAGGTAAPGGPARGDAVFAGPGSGGFRGGPGGGMPKDVQDRMMFDAQAASIFSYLVEKAGVEKTRDLVRSNREGKNTREFLTSPEILGPNLDNVEKDWQAWAKAQKSDPGMRIIRSGGRPAGPPQ